MRTKRLSILTAAALAGMGVWMAHSVRAVYSYYKTDLFSTIDTSYWQHNGGLSANGILTGAGNGGSLIAKTLPPNGLSEYEITTTLSLKFPGGTYVHFIRASQDARTGPVTAGTFYAVELRNVQMPSGGGCTAELAAYKRVGGVITNGPVWGVGCYDGMQIRTIYSNGFLNTYFGSHSVLLWADSTIAAGYPGVGVFSAPGANGFDSMVMGEKDTQAPQQVNSQSVSTLSLPGEFDLQWAEPADNPAGSGVGITYYWVDRRQGSGPWVWVGQPKVSALADKGSFTPGAQYTYRIIPMDYHWNVGPETQVTVTAPPAGSIDPRRVGLHSMATQWGGAGGRSAWEPCRIRRPGSEWPARPDGP